MDVRMGVDESALANREDTYAMNEDEKAQAGQGSVGGGPVESAGAAPAPQQSFGSAPGGRPGGDEEFGSAPKPTETVGEAPAPKPPTQPAPVPGRGGNVPLLVGGLVAVLVIVAAIFGFVMR